MAKRNKGKKGKSTASSKPPKLDLDYNPFTELGPMRDSMRKEASAANVEAERARAERARVAAEAQRRAQPLVASDDWVRTGAVHMSDEQLFEAALSGMDSRQITAGKYGDGGPGVAHVLPPAPEPELSDDPYAKDDNLWAREFGGDIRLVDDKYHVVEAAARMDIDALYKLRQRSDPKGPTREELLSDLLRPTGPTLSKAQIRLLDDAQRREKKDGAIPTLNLRGLSESVALHALDGAMRGKTYLRVITGKGLQSAGEPVLKQALVAWCLSHDVAWAPELFSDGSFGSFVVHQARKNA